MPALDCNHTHFILVDGARGSYSPDITLRAEFERYIQRHSGRKLGNVDAESPGEERTVRPVVLVVVEGGYGTIEIVHQALGQNNGDGESHAVDGIPVVIVGGSGRAADIIAKALRLKDKSETNDFLKKDIRDILGGNESQVDDCVKLLEEIRCHRNKKLVTVFEMDDANLDNIDEAILRAVLTMPALSGKVQLDLAVELNKSDIARDEILKPDKLSYWKVRVIYDYFPFRGALNADTYKCCYPLQGEWPIIKYVLSGRIASSVYCV
ncbi:transient receptor potential cation channel subfamily M member 2-like [Ptychodera flava]|uniref:transient receptor potential cation channel subfamily M member 2-like n=1 Tax=Ptychodera flava TaxID=63121 RepID=UPI00396A45D2